MIKFKKILLPYDFSPNCEKALAYALEMAKKFKSEITLIFVIHAIDLRFFHPLLSIKEVDIVREMKRKANSSFEEVKKNIPVDFKVSYVIKEGAPFSEILKYSQENNFDIIIMGTHGRSRISETLIGGTAEKVVRKSVIPVLVIKPDDFQYKLF